VLLHAERAGSVDLVGDHIGAVEAEEGAIGEQVILDMGGRGDHHAVQIVAAGGVALHLGAADKLVVRTGDYAQV